jgi:putative aldouronate transport system permease protein
MKPKSPPSHEDVALSKYHPNLSQPKTATFISSVKADMNQGRRLRPVVRNIFGGINHDPQGVSFMKKWRNPGSREGIKLFLLALPFVFLILAFAYVPLFGWIYAFFDYKVGLPLDQSPFIGFAKFTMIFTNFSEFLRVLRNTLVMSLLAIISTPLPAIFAIMLNEIKSPLFKKFVQTTTTLPNFISYILVFSLFFSVFSYDGLFNSILKSLGFSIPPIGVLGNNQATWLFQWFVSIWKNLGWTSIIYLAAIAGIDLELYDAAKVDGASNIQKIMHVTVPGMFSTFLVLFLLQISNILNNGFDQYFVFYNPLVADRIEVLDYYIFKIGILANDYSMATALGILKTLISVLLLFVANTVSKRLRGESIF